MLGPPPLDLLSRGQRSREFFAEDGKTPSTSDIPPWDGTEQFLTGTWIADVTIPTGMSLESCEGFLEGENKEWFLNLVRGMLQWRPEDRKTAKELFQDPWIRSCL